MADINLRAYTEYIENRLASDAFAEVAAQCRHILETYPKYVEAYKVLARALATQENYTEALDMFQRVLSADPNDFVAHVGMSECYKEDGALDQAIWHLERAFEQVPGNQEIQEAIRQLYEQRDGRGPRRVPMTSGALARMYLKGKLYTQAVSELGKALTRDPERLDLQVLLAEALWNNHQEVQAGKVAGEVLKKLPLSIDANSVLARLWLKAGNQKEARPFLERVKELDPYRGYELEKGKSPAKDAFRMMLMEYRPDQHGVRFGGAADWVSEISGIEKKEGVTGPLKDQPPGAASITDIFAEPTTPPAPAGPPTPSVAVPPAPTADQPDWLKEVLGQTPPPAPASDQPDWMKDVLGQTPPATPTVPTASAPEGAPDWLKDVGEPTPLPPAAPAPPPATPAPSQPAPAGDKPEWLDDVLKEETPSYLKPVTPEGAPTAPPDRDAPEWLSEILAGEQPAPAAPAASAAEPRTVSDEWLEEIIKTGGPEIADAGETTPVPAFPPLEAAGEPLDLEALGELEAWDSSHADEQNEEHKPRTGPLPRRTGPLPDWLKSEGATKDISPAQEPAVPQPTTPLESVPAPAAKAPALEEETLVAPTDDQTSGASGDQDVPDWLSSGDLDSDDAVKWLEEMAAKIDPNFKAEGEAPAAEKPTPAPEAEAEAEPAVSAPEPVEAAAKEEMPAAEPEPVAEAAAGEEVPDWLSSGDLDSDDAVKWLEEMAAKIDPNFKAEGEAPAAEKPAPEPEPAAPAPVEAAAKEEKLAAEPEAEEAVSEIPDWLKTEEEPAAPAPVEAAAREEKPTAEPQAEAVTAEVPDWLKPGPAAPAAAADDELEWLRKPAEEKEAEAAGEELPDWLKEPAASAEAEPAVAAEKPAAPPSPDDALAWLDEQVAGQGVSKDAVVSEALNTDQPPVAARPRAFDPDAKAEPVSADELPDWMKDAGAQEAMAAAPETRPSELADIPDLPVEAEELQWIEDALKAEETADVDIDLEALLSSKEPAAPAAEAKAEAKEEKKEEAGELPAWLTGGEEEEPAAPTPVAPPSAPEPAAEVVAVPAGEELPDWLKEPAESAAAGESGLTDFLKAVEPAAPATSTLDSRKVAPPPPAEAEAPPPTTELPTAPAPAAAAPPPAPPAAKPVPAGEAAAQLQAAREQLSAGELPAALAIYEGLVAGKQALEETVNDIQEVMKTRVVVNPRIYRVLGDAYMGLGKSKEALENYQKALDQF